VSSEREGADLGAKGERCAPTRERGGRVWLAIRRVAEVIVDLSLAREGSTIKWVSESFFFVRRFSIREERGRMGLRWCERKMRKLTAEWEMSFNETQAGDKTWT
jgi:hypothetical protein